MSKTGKIFVVSGPSGSGKTTLLARLMQDRGLKSRLVKSISLTTRPKRSRERHKIDYFFISLRQFHRYLRAGKILEWTKYLGYYYATPREFVQRQLKKSKHVLLCLDFRGARQIRRAYPKNTVLIFVAAPSLKALEERITKRCAKTKQEEICKRIQLARKEVLASRRYDYRLTNRNLQEAEKKLRDIISKEIASQN